MSITLTLTPAEEARLRKEAERNGLAPSELATQRLRQHWTVGSPQDDDLMAKLRKWQEEDGTEMFPQISTHELFAQWAEEDADMTQEEKDAEDRMWEDIHRSMDESRAASRAEWTIE